MRSLFATLLVFATAVAAHAQATPPQDPQSTNPTSSQTQSQTQSQTAPIVRSYPGMAPGTGYSQRPAYPAVFDTAPAAGISVRSDIAGNVQTVSSSAERVELRLTAGRADITVHHPANHSQILVDLPGGQVSLFKDGFYTLNAGNNIVRVLHGEAEAYIPGDTTGKGTKIREGQQLAFNGGDLKTGGRLRAMDAWPSEIMADVIGGPRAGDEGNVRRGYSPYGYGYYPAYPYYAGLYGYPGFYPYGYGYPLGFGLGFGYYGGGFGRGGFRR